MNHKNTSRHEDFLAMDRPIHRPKRRHTKLSRKKRLIAIMLCIVLVLGGLFCGGLIYVKSLLGNAERVELSTDNLGIVEPPHLQDEQNVSRGEVTNIALFGVDTRNIMSDSGNSDVIMILSIDREYNKIRLISIARDTYVAVEGYGNTKINHAYSYGGPELAIKTLNQNFQLNIQDFVTVNFSQVAEIIDYVGGVTVNVDSSEKAVANNLIVELNKIGIPTDPITQTGDVCLTGGQAVAYARDRTNGNDDARTGRQREVLMSLYSSVFDLPVSQYPGLVSMVLSQCQTSLTDGEMMDLGLWAVSANATIEQYAFPDDHVDVYDSIIDGVWYYVYDLDKASQILHAFIYEDKLPE